MENSIIRRVQSFFGQKSRSQTIGQKITLGAVVVMAFCTVTSSILLWFTLRSVSNANLEAVTRNSTVTAALAVDDVQRRIVGYTNALARRSEIAIAVTGGNIQALQEVLVAEYDSLKSLDQSVTAVEATSRTGDVLMRGHAPSERSAVPAAPNSVREALKGQPATGLAVSQRGQRLAFSAVAPLQFAEMVVGTIAVGSDLGEKTAAHIKEKTGAEIVFFVGGRAQASTMSETAISQLQVDNDIAEALSKDEEIQQTTSIRGHRYQVGFVPLRSDEGNIAGMMAVYVSREEVENTSRNALLRYLVLLGASLIFIVWAVFRLSNRLSKPVATLSDMGLRIAERDLRPTLVSSVGSDEIGRSVTGMSEAIDGLRTAFEAIAQHSTELSTASRDQAGASNRMLEDSEATTREVVLVSSAAEEVSANMNTAAAAVEELHMSIGEIARNSNDAAAVAQTAVSVAASTSKTINSLGRGSQEISKVIQIITSIAEQTNLLALNATIESARAGEAGRGFSVVADEVKQLARQTASATSEIEQQIQAIQADSNEAVEAIAEIGSTITRISDVLQAIATAVEQQTATTAEIGNSVTEAARGSSEIAQSIAQLSQRAVDTSATAEQTRGNASVLDEVAKKLQELVAGFRY